MSFEKLLAELDAMSSGDGVSQENDMTKSIAADEGGEDDAAIAAAAEDGAAAGDEGDGDEADEAGEITAAGDDEGEGEEPFGKSFRFTTEDGEEQEAYDATDLLKSLIGRLDQNETMLGDVLGKMTDLVKSQGAQIASLQGEVERLGQTGRGRKAVVTVTERPDATLSKSDPVEDGIPAGEFMAKAIAAQGAGRLSGGEVSRAEAYLNRGLAVPTDIVRKVMGA